jgi:peptide/nickel transport system permease protein
MQGTLVLLWTDVLLWICYLSIGIGFFMVFKRPAIRSTAQKILCKPLNFIATIILLLYIAIALLDSIHFEKTELVRSEGLVSLLDILLNPIGQSTETSFSSPLSCYSFVQETQASAEGSIVRDYPRLTKACQHLENTDERIFDLGIRTIYALFSAVKYWAWLMMLSWVLYLLFYRSDTQALYQQLSADYLPSAWQQKTKLRRFIAVSLLFLYPILWLLHLHPNGSTQQVSFPWKLYVTLSFILITLMTWSIQLSIYYHILGTDKVGQDVFYLALKSVRTGLIIGTLTTMIMLPFSIALGLMAGYFRGWVDECIQYLYTTLSAIPGVLLIAASVLSVQVFLSRHEGWADTIAERSDLRLLTLCFILGITSWTGLCRLLRGEALKLRQLEYIQAATALGVGHFKILWNHLLPNVMPMILIAITLDFSGLVLAEAVLSYVGVGVDPTTYSWGTMINGARLEMARMPPVWWSLAAAFGFMFVLVLSANLFSDALRDIFDPRLRHTQG